MSEPAGKLGIYVPGLGDERSLGQDQAMADWGKHGLDMLYFPLHWADKSSSWYEKFAGLISAIEDRYKQSGGQKIVLVGSSAGASAVLNAFHARPNKVGKVITICGKIYHPESLSATDFPKNPSFKKSLEKLPTTLASFSRHQLSQILCATPLYDGRVPVSDAWINGAHRLTIPMAGHVASIAWAVSFGKRRFVSFALSE